MYAALTLDLPFQAGRTPSYGGSCECYALSPIAVVGRWPLLDLLAGHELFATATTGHLLHQQLRLPVPGLVADVVQQGLHDGVAFHRFQRAE
jgi:hypothetical protein